MNASYCVLYDTRCMFLQLGKAAAEFSATARGLGPNGSMRSVEVYRLPKDLTLTLVLGYSVTLRHNRLRRNASSAGKGALKLGLEVLRL